MNGGFNASDALTPPETPPAATQLKESLQQRPKRLSIIADDEEEEGEGEVEEEEEETVEMEELISHGMGKKNGTLNGIDNAFNGHANDGDVTVEAELQLLSVSTDGKDEKVSRAFVFSFENYSQFDQICLSWLNSIWRTSTNGFEAL